MTAYSGLFWSGRLTQGETVLIYMRYSGHVLYLYCTVFVLYCYCINIGVFVLYLYCISTDGVTSCSTSVCLRLH